MTLETLVVWIVIGGIAGLLADAVVTSKRLGLLEAIVVGILGAFLGGWLFGVLDVIPPANIIGTLLTAFVGSIVLLFLWSALSRRV